MTGPARIGVDLGGTKIEGIRLEGSRVVKRLRRPTPRDDYGGTLDAIEALVQALEGGEKPAVGIGTPGSWLPGPERMQNCNSTWLNGRPLLIDLITRLGDRVRIANDADCFALSEASDGAAAGAGVVFGVILGTGVGGGVVVNGQLLKGRNGLVGEWGHTPAVAVAKELAGRTCYCGRMDCVETHLSGPGLHQSYKTLFPKQAPMPVDAAAIYAQARLADAPPDWHRRFLEDDLEGSQIVQALAASRSAPVFGDPVQQARLTLLLWSHTLAANLAAIVNLLDPDVIVLGGGLSEMQDLYPIVRELMAPHVFGEVFETALTAPAYGAASGVRGAAWLWPADA
ncbi:MAG: ROK family protein [Pseudomonadota bacterium]